MATEDGNLKISLETVGLTLSNTIICDERQLSTLKNYAPESLHRSFVFVSENGGDDSGSIVVLGKSSLDAIQTQSLASFEQIQQKSMSMDCQSIISSLRGDEVEKKLTELLQENLRLKETLEQNSLTMKQHLSTLTIRQEELLKVHEAHRQKFTETKSLVNQLKLENSELKANAQLKVNEKERKNENTQTDKEKEPDIRTASIDNDFAEEMLKLAEKSEEQAKEIAYLQKIIGSLNRQLEPTYRNLFAGIQLEDICSSSEPPGDSHRRRFLESFTHYNEKIQALGNCYVAQASRYRSIQECLQRCSEILSEKTKVASTTSQRESESCKELREHRSKLMDEELKTIIERQEMIQAQNEFQTIFTRYNATLLELESLRQERERFVSLQQSCSLHDARLDEAKANLKEREKLLEQERRAIEQDRSELSVEKRAIERQRLCLQEEERNLVEANASLNEELAGMRENNDLLRRQLKIYEEDYADEIKLRENMIAEKNDLLTRMAWTD